MDAVIPEYNKTIDLPCGGSLTYRLPNCLEQLRFFVDSKWQSKDLLMEQIEGAIPHLDKFIVEIKSEKYSNYEEIVADRKCLNVFVDFALDIGNQLDEVKKKS